jgi:tetratricopeptide (TPR) repeat protein
MRGNFLKTCAFAILATSLPALADVASLTRSWDEIMYQQPPPAREQALKALTETARAEVAAKPKDAALLIWYGIVASSYAGAEGGLGALGLAKEARAALEQAIDIDPGALEGSAYTSLGTLYYKVPGWPIGFGSDKKARENLEKALVLNPTGIDPNYFMGEFLFEQGEYAHARSSLTAALAAPDRPGRPLGDEGRRNEIRALLAKVDAKLGPNGT